MRLPLASPALTGKRLLVLVRSYAAPMTAIVGLQLLAALSAVSLPWIVGDIVDAIGAGTTRQWVLGRIGIALVLVALNFILVWLSDYKSRILGERLFAILREDLVDAVVRLPLSTVESAGSGDLIGRTTHDIDRVQMMIRRGLSAILVLVTTVLVTLVAAAIVSPRLVWVLIAEIPLVVLVAKWYVPRTIPSYQASSAVVAEFSGVASETVAQAETVDALRLGPTRWAKYDSLLAQMWRLERYGAWMRVFLFVGMVIVTLSPIALLIALGAVGVPAGWVSAGAVTTMVMYCYQLRVPLWEATFWSDELQFAYTSLQRIFGVDLVEADRRAREGTTGGGAIVVDSLGYAYREGAPVLHDVSLTLREGETLAIVGPSGAGKSTLGRMIAGIHPPSSGTVRAGGVDLVDLPEKELRRTVVLVTQEHHVFVGSIAQNLRLAAADADDEALWEALRAVGAADWVANEGGLEMRVGAGGAQLPPARAQQIALARIILMNPSTLVLDEATSLLDSSSARSVEQSLARVLQGRTVVAIAHRLHTAHEADRVAVMVDGRIAELGTHDELLALGGEYARLWKAWRGGD